MKILLAIKYKMLYCIVYIMFISGGVWYLLFRCVGIDALGVNAKPAWSSKHIKKSKRLLEYKKTEQ